MPKPALLAIRPPAGSLLLRWARSCQQAQGIALSSNIWSLTTTRLPLRHLHKLPPQSASTGPHPPSHLWPLGRQLVLTCFDQGERRP